MENETPDQWEVIDIYSRKQAINDGFQIQCPDEIRKEAGIKYPVFFTTTLWEKYIQPPAQLEGYGQSLDGRLWDLLFMWVFNVRSQRPSGPEMSYEVIFTMPHQKKDEIVGKQVTIPLYSVIGPTDFDDPAPAITIMLPGED